MKKDKNTVEKILLAVLLVSMFASVVLLIFAVSKLKNSNELLDEYRNSLENVQRNEPTQGISDLLTKSARLQEECDSLRKQISEKSEELTLLKESFGNENELYAVLNSEINTLKDELASLDAENEALKKNIYNRSPGIDLTSLANAVVTLDSLVKNPVPKKVHEIVRENGVPVTDKSGNAVFDTVEYPATAAIFMKDSASGCSFGINEDLLFSINGYDKLFYAYSVLYMSKNSSDFPSADSEAEDGVAYSDIICKMLKLDDAGSFASLKAAFGEDIVPIALKSLGFTHFYTSDGMTTAKEIGIVFNALLSMLDSSDSLMRSVKDALISSVRCNGCTLPDNAAVKCFSSESATCEAGIVYDGEPFIFVILSDYESSDSSVKYINEVYAGISSVAAALH